jgi:uncharacterized protein
MWSRNPFNMNTLPIIDFHAHVFPDKIAAKATESIGAYYGVKMAATGTVRELVDSGDVSGIAGYLIHSTATRPDQVRAINDYISGLMDSDPRFIGFGTLHPEMDDPEAEMAYIQGLGLRGVKFHPDFQGFSIDDSKMNRLYSLCEGRLPILMHMGDERRDWSSPRRLARVLDRFPGLTVFAAHLGGYSQWEEAESCLTPIPAGRNLYFDTSSSLWVLKPTEALRLIRKYGTDRVMFGTDFPLTTHREELKRFLALELTEKEQHDILWKNALRVLGLPSRTKPS